MKRHLTLHRLLVGATVVTVAGLSALGVALGPGLLARLDPALASGAQQATTPRGPGGIGGMMGPGGMGVAPSAHITSAAAIRRQIGDATRDAQVVASAGEIIYSTTQVSLVMVGAPAGRPGMYWQADGLVNPTIVVPSGSTITVHFADGDPGTHHGWELTATSPPYPRMVMMEAPPVVGAAFAIPVPPPDGSRWYGRTVRFTAPASGTYHYLCPVPGHAEKGMWGTLVVA